MSERVTKRLHDAFDACNQLQRIGQSRSRSEFLADNILRLAVWKLIEIVGEALHQAEKIDPTLETSIPEFRRVVDTRNRITHGYDSIDFNLLWDIVISRIDPLLDTLESLLIDE